MQTEKFQTSLEMLGDVLYLHYHGNLSPTTPSDDLSRHRVAFMGLAVFIVNYVQTMLPRNKVNIYLLKENTCDTVTVEA